MLSDRINTRDLLRRRGMILESYTCELCILQRPESSEHLLLRCNFAKACWSTIGVTYNPSRTALQIFRRIKQQLRVPFAMEIIILMWWSIWTTKNDWIFNNKDPPSSWLQKETQIWILTPPSSGKTKSYSRHAPLDRCNLILPLFFSFVLNFLLLCSLFFLA